MDEQQINDGVILGERETDFGFAGADSPIPYVVVKEDGDWREHLPVGEKQYSSVQDTMGCVSFSALNSIEMQVHQQTGERVDYSDRFTAKDSNTQPTGNWLWRVGDSIRNNGVVLEEVWPDPQDYTWDTFYAPIPPEVYEKAREWKKTWRVDTQFIPLTKEALTKALKQAPVQVVFPNHAVVSILCEEDIVRYFDTYKPWEKERTFASLTSAYQYVLTKNTPVNTPSKALATWLVRCLQAMEGYNDPAGVTYWANRIVAEGWNAVKAYFMARIPDRRKEQAADVADLDALGTPPQE